MEMASTKAHGISKALNTSDTCWYNLLIQIGFRGTCSDTIESYKIKNGMHNSLNLFDEYAWL